MHDASTGSLIADRVCRHHDACVHRRTFLHVAGVSALASCIHGPVAGTRLPIRAIAFDLFTIFDPRTVDRRVAALLPGADASAFATTWKSRLFEYSWLRAAGGRYLAFDRLALDALHFTERTYRVALTPQLRDELVAAFTTLDLWPDAVAVLHQLRARGLRLAPLANFAPAMISALLAHHELTGLFDDQISSDAARTYKPDPRAYELAERAFDLPRTQIAFAAFGSWDAAGGSWFGFPTFWVNRLGVTPDELDPVNVATGSDLVALEAWISGGT